MIEIKAIVDEEGLLRACGVTGHAGAGPKGGDIVCAAVSVLARTGAEVLSNRTGIRVLQEAPQRGVFWMEIDCAPKEKDFLFGAGTFLLEGLKSVSQEYPDYCSMTIWRN
ncbi:MAG: ribosomal-processing cysteine protease Prp [Spirochaetaceae bacterium]|jgi:uncharacterized protein YsxB (DUF464 family)|nr:ribosomal-processing cysteine protease Prp [Spirochaetaceae bacterium]